MPIAFTPIGFVKNQIFEAREGFTKKKEQSEIEILPEFADGLYKLEENTFIDVLFHFNRSENYELVTPIFTGETKGVFASRSPHRPNGIGVTTVQLHSVQHNKLVVSGLDAMNGTPVMDIKPCDTSFAEAQLPTADIRKEKLKNNPRFEIIKAIKSEDYEWLLIQAGQLHGHFCPGLAMGVFAAVKAVNELKAASDGMEDVLALTETNNCFSDGVQLVTGCSFGNNALIFRDLGKTAVTLARRNGHGFRICSKVDSRDIIQESFPDFEALFQEVIVKQNHDKALKAQFKKASRERSFGIFELPFDELFTLKEVTIEIPPYAPIFDSIICAECGERTMLSRTLSRADKTYCLTCSQQSVPMLSGDGIHFS